MICPLPMAVRLTSDLRPSMDGSAVRTSLVADQLQVASVPIAWAAAPHSQHAILGWDRQTDGSQYCLIPPYGGGITSEIFVTSVVCYCNHPFVL